MVKQKLYSYEAIVILIERSQIISEISKYNDGVLPWETNIGNQNGK